MSIVKANLVAPWVSVNGIFDLANSLNRDSTFEQYVYLRNSFELSSIECGPILARNIAKNEVVKYFYSEVHGTLKNAEHIDPIGLFVGNYHYPIPSIFDALITI